ncbi:DUF397 domain-containing protein [Streptomyces sp. x-19]|uniref:DUF397 domain-containing protein n=1 Tax=Streptomyces sp. x-19 TaxID=2789280 RepID=UPI00397EAB75
MDNRDLDGAIWHRSSYSGTGGNCVEVVVWRKSSYSSANGQCVEVTDGQPDVIPVRDSKNPTGPHLVFGVGAWESFVTSLKNGASATV